MTALLLLLFQVDVDKDVKVPMRDGVRLAADLYRPPGEGKFPAILVRSPYGKSGERGNGNYFAARGYVYVAMDTRGRFGSEGTWGGFCKDDERDGFDTAAWIVKQPWSDGKFGMIGTSYVGGTQHAMALSRPEGLATLIPVDAVSNMGVAGMRNGGAFELRFWNWIMSIGGPNGSAGARDPATAAALKEMMDQRLHYLKELPLRKGTTPLKLVPEYEDWLVEAMGHGVNDAFWDHVNVLDHADRYKDVPVYLVGGWYDSWAGNTTANYRALTEKLKSPVHLIMGPWIHGAQGSFAHGQVSFGREAALADPLGWRLAWYDKWLKGKEGTFPKVRVFVMGTGDCRKDAQGKKQHGGYWRDEAEWPPARARSTKFHLKKGGALSTGAPDGEGHSTSWLFDPKRPVPTIGGNISSGNGILLQGAWDQRGGAHVWNLPEPVALSARNDVLVFRTEPLEADVEVTGEIEARLWVSSSAPDTDFTAKLVDVHPPNPDFPGGFDQNITEGILRARFRESLKVEKLMEPGKVYPVTVRLYPTSNVFKKGHRIRVDLSSSSFPRFDVNPNTGEPLNDNRRWAVATNTVWQDRERPSHIVLPVIPAAK